MRSMLPKRLGPYLIEGRLASGGMAEVYVAHREGPHGFRKKVALKCILPDHARDDDFMAMFIDEAMIAAQLNHPNIVQVFDFGEDNDALFIAMELVDGTSVNRLLRAVVARGEVVPLGAALHIASEAARALSYVHSVSNEQGEQMGLVHRDISPANLLLTRRGHVKVTDFGIARCLLSPSRTEDGQVRGKLGYMSPEQVTASLLTGRSDVFALSVVLAEMLIGEPLFGRGADLDILLRIRNVDTSVLYASKRGMPADVRQVILWALERNEIDRPSAAQFAQAIDDIAKKRGLLGTGPRLVSRLLHQHELVSPGLPEDFANEPGARPTMAIPEVERASTVPPAAKEYPSDRPTNDVAVAGRDELLALLAGDAPVNYELKRDDGTVVGPLSYADVVRRIVSGEITASSALRRESGTFTRGNEVKELRRYLSSPALVWEGPKLDVALLKGRIKPGTLLPVVHHLMAKRQTGALHLTAGLKQKKIYFNEGKPEFVASNDTSELFGEYLVRKGICIPMEVEMALAVLPKFEGRLGDALVGLGVLKAHELYRALSGQVRERYLSSFRLREGTWSFYEGVRVQEETYPFGHGPHELVRDAVLEADTTEMESALRSVQERLVVLAPQPVIPLSSFGVPKDWARLLDVDGSRTLSRIVSDEAARKGDVLDVYRAFYFGFGCSIVKAA